MIGDDKFVQLMHAYFLSYEDVLPSEEVAMILPKLAVVKLAHNNIAIKEPFFIPKFLLELEG